MPRLLPRYLAEPFSTSTPQATVLALVPRWWAVVLAPSWLLLGSFLAIAGALVIAGAIEGEAEPVIWLMTVLSPAAMFYAWRFRRHLVVTTPGLRIVNLLRANELDWTEIERIHHNSRGRLLFDLVDGGQVTARAFVAAPEPHVRSIAADLETTRRHVARGGDPVSAPVGASHADSERDGSGRDGGGVDSTNQFGADELGLEWKRIGTRRRSWDQVAKVTVLSIPSVYPRGEIAHMLKIDFRGRKRPWIVNLSERLRFGNIPKVLQEIERHTPIEYREGERKRLPQALFKLIYPSLPILLVATHTGDVLLYAAAGILSVVAFVALYGEEQALWYF